MGQTKTFRVNRDQVGDETVETQSVETTTDSTQTHALNKVIQVVQFVAGVLSLLILIRFLLLLLGAARIGVVNFIYQITQPLVEPFYGMFGRTLTYTGGRVEFESIFAVIAIGFVAFVVIELVRLLK